MDKIVKHKKKRDKGLSPGAAVAYINDRLGVSSFIKPPEYWLDTGSSYLNKVMGSKKLGLAYGKMITLAGPPSSGKSLLAAKIAGLAQVDGADVAWVDRENSYDSVHVGRQGLDSGEETDYGYTKVALFRSIYGKFKRKLKSSKGKEKSIVEERSETAEELCARVEIWMKLRRRQNPKGKLCVVVDSVTSLSPEEEMVAGLTDQNMRTKMSPAVFLNSLTKSWVDLSLHTNALIIFIAQLRTNPKVMFGNPDYVPGGKGILYYPSVVVWMRRVKDGEIKKSGRQVGVKGLITNKKNKAGGGSVERKKCGYLCWFSRDKWKFMDADEVKGE